MEQKLIGYTIKTFEKNPILKWNNWGKRKINWKFIGWKKEFFGKNLSFKGAGTNFDDGK